MKHDSAIAESIGALMLITILVAAAGIITVVVLSWYPVWVVPDTNIEVYNESYTYGENTIFIQNKGGESLPAGNYYIRVYDSAGDELMRKEYTEDFVPGTTLQFNYTTLLDEGSTYSGEYASLQFIYHEPNSGKDVLLYQQGLIPPG